MTGCNCTILIALATTMPLALSDRPTVRVPLEAVKTPKLAQFWPSMVASLGANCWFMSTVASVVPALEMA